MTKVINVLEMENIGTQENRFEANKKNRLPKMRVSYPDTLKKIPKTFLLIGIVLIRWLIKTLI